MPKKSYYDITEIERLRRKGLNLRKIADTLRFEDGHEIGLFYDYQSMRNFIYFNFTWNMAKGRYERKLK